MIVMACCGSNIQKRTTSAKMNIYQASIIHDLVDEGRLKYFFHCPKSIYPIRDVLGLTGNGIKTEPHIEARAENYCWNCYQSNVIKPLIENNEKYLFLMTNCRNSDVITPLGNHYRYVVGYIERETSGHNMDGGRFIRGKVNLIPFEDAMPIVQLGFKNSARLGYINKDKVKQILDHFKSCKNIYEDCISEITRLDPELKSCRMVVDHKNCPLINECRRLHPV
jgi:hypothetical protein